MDVVLDGETVTINVKDRLPDRQWDGGTLTINLKKHYEGTRYMFTSLHFITYKVRWCYI